MLCGSLLAALIAVSAEAADIDAFQAQSEPKPAAVAPAKKVGFLGRLFNGVKNVVVAPLDIPCTIARVATDSENPILGVVVGSVEGIVNGTVRLAAGVTEVVTSPVPGSRYPMYERDLGERSLREKADF